MAGLLAMILWAGIPTVFKAGIENAPTTFLLLWRFIFSIPFFIISLFHILKKIDIKKHGFAFFQISISLFVSYYFFSRALSVMPASQYIILYTLNPLVSIFIFRVKFSLKLFLAITLAIVGTFFSTLVNQSSVSIGTAIFLFLFTGMLGWAWYTKVIVNLKDTFTPYETAAITHVLSLAVCVIWWLTEGTPKTDLSFKFLTISALFGVISPLAFYFFAYAMKFFPVFGLVSQFLEPALGLLFAFVFLGDIIALNQIGGIVLILLGVFLASGLQEEPA